MMAMEAQRLLRTFAEFDDWGVPVDAFTRRKAIAAARAVKIERSGNMLLNVEKAGFDVYLDLCMESERNLHIADIELDPPFFCAGFHWLPKLTPKLARERGYVLPHSNLGPFFPSDLHVLNHYLGSDFRLIAKKPVRTLLLGSSAELPLNYVFGEKMNAALRVTARDGRCTSAWFTFCVQRSFNPEPRLVKRRRLLTEPVTHGKDPA